MSNMTVKVELAACDSISQSNNNNFSHLRRDQNQSDQANSTNLDSVVQRLIDKKMGRRKQNCPQRTGMTSEDGKTLFEILRG